MSSSFSGCLPFCVRLVLTLLLLITQFMMKNMMMMMMMISCMSLFDMLSTNARRLSPMHSVKLNWTELDWTELNWTELDRSVQFSSVFHCALNQRRPATAVARSWQLGTCDVAGGRSSSPVQCRTGNWTELNWTERSSSVQFSSVQLSAVHLALCFFFHF